MTALDPGPIIAELREQKVTLGQYDPRTVEALIDTTERTGELPIALRPVPSFPRCGRTMAPADLGRFGTGAPALALVSHLCGERHPERAILCGEGIRYHGPQHIAYGANGRVLAEWPARSTADSRTPPLISTDHHGGDQHGSEEA